MSEASIINASDSINEEQEGLIRLDRMYESLRYNDYSVEGGLGELVDNAVEAGADNISVEIKTEKTRKNNKGRPKVSITQIATIDDGCGMSSNVLSRCLVLGESIRTTKDGKLGIGRFGVGMTLGGISLARRLEVYSRTQPNDDFLYTYIDLDEIQDGALMKVPYPTAAQPDQAYANILNGSSGTIVILSKCDRITGNIEGLTNYLGRTYRKYIQGGRDIKLNGETVFLHDPLYMASPTIFDVGGNDGKMDFKAESLGSESIELDIPNTDGLTAKVTIKMSLLPKEWRLEQGAGGSPEAKKRKIDQNEGVSILRADREVLYGHVPYITGAKGAASALDIDRWWGCEISFPPELDDYFQVRYIKRGAEPIPFLRDKIKGIIQPTIDQARKTIRKDWAKRQSENHSESGFYKMAEETMAEANHILPRSKKGHELSRDEAEQKLDEVIRTINDKPLDKKAKDERKEEIKKKPYAIETVSLTENILFQTVPILGTIIVKLNVNHPFYKQVLLPLCGPLNDNSADMDVYNKQNDIKNAILLLIFSYAKAEAMFSDHDDFFENIRLQWGTVLSTALNQYEK